MLSKDICIRFGWEWWYKLISKSTVKGGSFGKWSEYFHEMVGVVCAIVIVQQRTAKSVIRIFFI